MKNRYLCYLISAICMILPVTRLSAETLPEFFGFYLRSGEQLTELQVSTVEAGGLSSLTGIAVESSTPSFILYHDQISPHDLRLTQLRYTFQTNEQGKWIPTETIPLKIAPLEGKPSMYLLVPGSPLEQGVYAIHSGNLTPQSSGLKNQAHDFVVGDPTQVIEGTIHRTQADIYSQEQASWDQAVAEYLHALQLSPEDVGLQGKLALLYYQKQDYPAAIEAFQHLVKIAPEVTLY